jgi:uncharacterized protein YbaP (TraB family)
MKPILSTIILVLLLSIVSGQTPSTRLWRITGKGLVKPSYLFGSMHVDDERVFRFSDSLLFALGRCEQFSNEVAPDSITGYLYQRIDDRLHEKMQKDYFDDEEEEEALQDLSLNTGLDKATLKKVSPVVLKQLIPLVTGNRKRRSTILDFYLYNVARQEGKECIGIESIASQVQMFNVLHDSLKYRYVTYSLGKKRLFRSPQQIDLYLSANLDELHKQMKTIPAEIYKVLITDRNIGMAASIDSISQLSSTFYTVGVGHLTGDEGLIKLLRDRGYRVDPVKETFTGAAEKFVFSRKAIPMVTYTDEKTGYSVDLPSQWYSSPSLPQSVSHALCYDLGSNVFYMTFGRPLPGSTANADSLLNVFVSAGWKIQLDKKKIRRVVRSGIAFSETDELELQGYKAKVSAGIAGNSLMMMAVVYQDHDTANNPSRYFDSFRLVNKKYDSWNLFTSKTGGYQVLFPGNPDELILNKADADNPMLTVMLNGTDNTTGQEFVVQYIDYPDKFFENDSSVFAAAIEGMISKSNYLLVKDSALSVQGFPARMSIIQLADVYRHACLMVLRGSRFYMVLGTDNQTETDSILLERFFGSFAFAEVDWDNWTMKDEANGLFSLIAPSELVEEPDDYFTGKYESSSWYTTNDKMSGEKIIVRRRVFSPFFRYTTSDSSFFLELFNSDFNFDHANDTILKQEKLPLPFTYVFEYELPGSHLISRHYYSLRGRSLYSFTARIPKPYVKSYPWNKAGIPFRITDTTQPGDLKADHTAQLLNDLSSQDSIVHHIAKEALSFYEFSDAELPKVWNTLYKSLPDDSAKFESGRVQLITAVEKQLDSLYADRMISAFDSVFPTPASKVIALSILADPQDFNSMNFVKEKLLNIPRNSVYAYRVFYKLYDSLEYTSGFFPEIFDFIYDTLNRSEVINVAALLIDSNRIDKSNLVPYRDAVFSILKEYCERSKDPEWSDYYLSKAFLIGGHLNDPEINNYLADNLGKFSSYAFLYAIEALENNEVPVKKKFIEKAASDVELRHEFYNYLSGKGKLGLMPVKYQTQAAIAESDVYNYLIMDDYSPQDVESVGFRDFEYKGQLQRFFLVKFKDKYDDAGMLNYTISGPFPIDGSMPVLTGDATGWYWSSDRELSAQEHLRKAEADLTAE